MKFVNPRWQFIFQYKLLKRELLAANFRDGVILPEQSDQFLRGVCDIAAGGRDEVERPLRERAVGKIEAQRDIRGRDHAVTGQRCGEAGGCHMVGGGEL